MLGNDAKRNFALSRAFLVNVLRLISAKVAFPSKFKFKYDDTLTFLDLWVTNTMLHYKIHGFPTREICNWEVASRFSFI